MKQRVVEFIVALFFAILMLPSALAQQDTERVTYSKVFPGSNPDFQLVTLIRTGEATYKQTEDDPDPVNFRIPDKVSAQIFDLAKELAYFAAPLESGLKIAKMGDKTFRYEGAETHSQTFNYSTDLNAQKLLELFEKIAESQRLFLRLEYSLRFDRLGVNDALIAIDSARHRDRLIGADHLLPLLDQIINSKRYMNISRNRADAIARGMRQSIGQGAQ